MNDVVEFRGTPASRRNLAKQLRDLAAYIETDMLETEPHGIFMCLMGSGQFEVVVIGQTEGWAGAKNAMIAVLTARFDTEGGNIRTRMHPVYEPRKAAPVLPFVVALKTNSDAASKEPTP